jgi:hypothetical protein
MVRRVDRKAEADRLLQERGFLIFEDEDGIHIPSRTGPLGTEWVVSRSMDYCPCPDHRIRFATCAHMRCAVRWKRERRAYLIARRKAKAWKDGRQRVSA